MRLFIATPVTLPFYSAIKQNLSKFVDGKWVEGWNLHLTHKFIGEDEPKKYESLKFQVPSDKFKVKGIGLFGNKVLYLKADIDDSINRQINEQLGLKNDKAFIPHVTLCRIKNIKDKKGFFENIKKWEDKEIEIPFDVYLYKSTLTKKGPIYEKIYKYKSSGT